MMVEVGVQLGICCHPSPNSMGAGDIENSRIKQDREVGRRVYKANKYNMVKRERSVVRKEERERD